MTHSTSVSAVQNDGIADRSLAGGSRCSKTAIYDAFKAWRDGGPACSGQFDMQGVWKPRLTTHTTRFDQAGKKIVGVERVFDTNLR